jgi:uncharacterized protein YijF (DUF1287 family)
VNRNKKIIILAVCCALSFCFICGPCNDAVIPGTVADRIKSPVDFNGNGLDDYGDFLQGARIDASNRPAYDDRYWDSGYPPDDIGVCTDVIWRAFRHAGYSLRLMVDKDISNSLSAYDAYIDVPDSNIDFRRVVNLNIFFKRHAISLTLDPADTEEWQPGDIVVFSSLKNRASHIGIISDKRRADGVAYIIHNGGQNEREEDYLYKEKIIGHYRFDASLVDDSLLIPWEGDK